MNKDLANGSQIRNIGACKHFLAPVAQLDRVAGSDPVGRGFESLQARHFLLGGWWEFANVSFEICAAIAQLVEQLTCNQ